jgi:hypothetical protein
VAGERDASNMTMYLSNSHVRPTGYEAGEFIEPPIIAPPPVESNTSPPEAEGEGDEVRAS